MHPRKSPRKALASGLGMAGLALLTGCGGGGGGTQAPVSASAQTPNGLTATLTQEKSTVTHGETVTYTLTLTNNTNQTISYEAYRGCGYVGRENAFLRIANADGEVKYPDQDGGCSQISTPPPALAPGASVSDTYTPPASVFTAGHYTVIGSFDTIYGDESLQTNTGPLTVDVT